MGEPWSASAMRTARRSALSGGVLGLVMFKALSKDDREVQLQRLVVTGRAQAVFEFGKLIISGPLAGNFAKLWQEEAVGVLVEGEGVAAFGQFHKVAQHA